MRQSDLRDYIKCATTVLREDDSMDEANTDQRLITYFLKTLGWDGSDDIGPDYPVSIGAYSIDYALRASHGGRSGILLKTEASATDSRLTIERNWWLGNSKPSGWASSLNIGTSQSVRVAAR